MKESNQCGGACGSKENRQHGTKDPETAAQDQIISETLGAIDHKFLVMSGKGGVGKSSVSTNLAMALSRKGMKVGLMDVDLHGPDIPRMLGLEGLLEVNEQGRILPKEYTDHLKVVSVDSLTEDQDSAIIWRGPLKLHVVRQFLSHVQWGKLDYLFIDTHPGLNEETLLSISISNALLNKAMASPWRFCLDRAWPSPK